MRIGVLSIFHPQHLTVATSETEDLVLSAGARRVFVHPRSSCSAADLSAAGDTLVMRCGRFEIRTAELRAAARNQQATKFVLKISGKLARQYQGILEVKAKNGEIIPVVEMDLELAVASVVLAEAEPDAPFEALKAQAVVSRSYLVAGRGRHTDFDFCDLTHCQLLREPPEADGRAAQAAAATRGMVLAYADKPFAAMFTRSCGGDTRVAKFVIGTRFVGRVRFLGKTPHCCYRTGKTERSRSGENWAGMRFQVITSRCGNREMK